ncbi:MAG: hypothetical protein ACOZQL_28355 [Myxococcota bacterium]
MTLLLALVLTQSPLVVETPCEGFSLIATSPSGALPEDDQRLEVLVEGARFPIPLGAAWFTGAGTRSRAKALRCRDGVVAWEVRPGVVVLLLSRSGRPGLDLLSFALVDLRQRRALQVLDTTWELASGRTERPGGVTFSFVLREAKGGFDVRAVREWLADDDSLEGAMQDWLAVRVKGARLTASWLRP